MIGNLLGFVLVFGVVVALGWVTRSVLAALAGGIALSVLVFSAVAVQLGSDLGSILDYAADPKAPMLVVFSDGPTAVAGVWVKLREIRENGALMNQFRNPDPKVAAAARETLRQRFAADLTEEQPGPPPPILVHRLIASGVQALDPPALKRFADRVREHGWAEAAKGSFRLVRVDVSGARAVLDGHASVPFKVPTATGTVDAQVKPQFVLDCITAPDCYDRLMGAVHDPDRAVVQLGDTKGLSQLVAEDPEIARTLEMQASYFPPGAYANAAASLMALALAGRTVAETGLPALNKLLAAPPIEIFPKTPIARLLDRTLTLATSGPLATLLQSAAMERLKRLNG